ncbi:hypothetical protein J6E39_06570 [bacterium]|nr:hypothetical protein [bacterium]
MTSSANAAGINGLGFFPGGLYNSYATSVMLNDLTGMSEYPQMMGWQAGMGINPMSMNGSIFGGGMDGSALSGGSVTGDIATSGMGTMPMGMGTMVPFGGMGGYQEAYFDYMDKNQDFMINYQLKNRQKMRNAEMSLNSPEEGVNIAAEHLNEKIKANEQQQIRESLEHYYSAVGALYGDSDPQQIKNRAAMLYQRQFGSTITDDIRKYGNSSFYQGFLQTLTLGIADKKTAEQNIAELTGQPVGRSENAKKIGGNILGGTVLGAGVAVSANTLMKTFKIGCKSKPFIAGLIGAGVGLLAAVFTANKD